MLWPKQARFSVKGPDLIRGSKFLVTPVHLPQEGLGFFVLFCLGAAIIATWCMYPCRPYRLFFSCVYFGGQCWHLSFYVSMSFKLLPTYFHVTSLHYPCLASDLPHRGLPSSSLFSPELMPGLPGPLCSLPLSPPFTSPLVLHELVSTSHYLLYLALHVPSWCWMAGGLSKIFVSIMRPTSKEREIGLGLWMKCVRFRF